MVQTKGTKEFADNNFNWCYGCNNNCVYCYSKWMAVKFKRIQSESEWEIMRPNLKITNKKRFKKYDGIIMTPTSHDITEDSIDTGIKLYKKLLETGNELLITTKPKSSLIERLMSELKPFRDQITFRFTITSFIKDVLKFFEPGAPNFVDRYKAVSSAFHKGWKTSLLIEPFLDEDPTVLINQFFYTSGSLDIITDTVWLGIMNPSFIHYFKDRLPANFLERYSYENLQKIVNKINNEFPSEIRKKIRLKDSIKNLGFEINNKEKINCPYCHRELGNLTKTKLIVAVGIYFFLEKTNKKP